MECLTILDLIFESFSSLFFRFRFFEIVVLFVFLNIVNVVLLFLRGFD